MSRIAGKRNARRIAAVCPIRLWGMDAAGKPFIEAATTVNVSYTGVLLKDVPAKLSVGDTIACDQASTSAGSVSFGWAVRAHQMQVTSDFKASTVKTPFGTTSIFLRTALISTVARMSLSIA